VHLVASDNGTHVILTYRDAPPEIVLGLVKK